MSADLPVRGMFRLVVRPRFPSCWKILYLGKMGRNQPVEQVLVCCSLKEFQLQTFKNSFTNLETSKTLQKIQLPNKPLLMMDF